MATDVLRELEHINHPDLQEYDFALFEVMHEIESSRSEQEELIRRLDQERRDEKIRKALLEVDLARAAVDLNQLDLNDK